MKNRKDDEYRNRIELLQGTLDMLILQTLQWGTQHGYAISQALRTRSAEVLQVETGSLYPALHRMERHKWVAAEWRMTEQNQRARFYKITPEGRKQLARDRSEWDAMVTAIASILET
jgi:PadR family transcriptional regulator, regulatory protein PadR